ncbi:amidohydrolase 2 [Coniophora puteana RWD-64-598 SS2]|uniref:Amidohydrolase 2 n=1 Tax=Coniophora puteana (strain RWD-64-598) TaxID=741705 RepID=A0A5M3MT62_CONPW|nr:amidohydrolase 2 [Coniophora puteana RWD-64-598 SS2]EIW82359.1 amidohydrolase 2 [Coniophora puteana RWD-64-598 SS2]
MSSAPLFEFITAIAGEAVSSAFEDAPLVDVHTHVYLPRYADALRARKDAPRIASLDIGGRTEERLLILDGEPAAGRPVGPQYWDREEKLKFMRRHNIDVSIVSLANPWLDFLSPDEAIRLANDLNVDMDAYCAGSPIADGLPSLRTLYGFGVLPLAPQVPVSAIVDAVRTLKNLPNVRGVIMGTRGVGAGLDDNTLEPLWEAIQASGLVVFIHPHYGVDSTAFGPRDNGHVLPLALGFPFETTIAASRLILAGVLDRYPDLKLLLAHSGGALPALSSRLASCVAHDPIVSTRLKHDARFYLGKLYYDAVAYGPDELSLAAAVVGRAHKYSESGGSYDAEKASRQLLFGTDHPFFPPLEETQRWRSVDENLAAIQEAQGLGVTAKDEVRGRNALRLFDLIS